jgi:hypothetical protein
VRNTAIHRQGGVTTGLSAKSGSLDLIIYDKRLEVLAKALTSEAYLRAMIQNRWGGRLPDCATRIEYQIQRERFADPAMRTVEGALKHLPSLVAELTRFDEHPFFLLTDRVPDRAGRHQNRANALPSWERAIQHFRALVGEPGRKLQKPQPGMMNAKLAVSRAMGAVCCAAAQLEMYIGDREGLLEVFRMLLDRNEIRDDTIHLKWEELALRAGNLEKVSKFEYGANLAA